MVGADADQEPVPEHPRLAAALPLVALNVGLDLRCAAKLATLIARRTVNRGGSHPRHPLIGGGQVHSADVAGAHN